MDALRGHALPESVLRAEETRVEAEALLVLRGLPDVGFVALERLLGAFGSAHRALRASSASFAALAGASADRARGEPARHEAARDMIDRAGDAGIEVVPRGAPDYPRKLFHLAQPPAVLFQRGDGWLPRRPVVAVVGSRRASAYGRRVATEVARALAERGVVVASGLALGVDAAAHRACLEAGGATLAVLGSGVDVPHPPSNRGLFQRIAREGLLVSEFDLGTPPLPHHFPRRNRILAALADGVLVVEAAARSGALITADLALELGRTVMAVPGPVFAERSVGTNRLLRQGAAMLTDPLDVLELVEDLPVEPSDARREPPSPMALGPTAVAVWEALGSVGQGVDELARGSALEAGPTLAALVGLELGGWADREPGMRFVRRGAGSRVGG